MAAARVGRFPRAVATTPGDAALLVANYGSQSVQAIPGAALAP